MGKEDWNHVNGLGDLKDTKYWFKRDAKTIKKGINKAIKSLPLLIIISALLSLGITCWGKTFNLNQFLITTLALIPISFLGYFLFYIMVNKGYNIYHDGGGTVINGSRNPNPYSEASDKSAN